MATAGNSKFAPIGRGHSLKTLTGQGVNSRSMMRGINAGIFSDQVFKDGGSADLTLPAIYGGAAANYMRENGRWVHAKNGVITDFYSTEPGDPLPQPEARAEFVRSVNGYLKEHSMESYEMANRAMGLYTAVTTNGNGQQVLTPKTLADLNKDDHVVLKEQMPATLATKLFLANRAIDHANYDLTFDECVWIITLIGHHPTRQIVTNSKEALCEFFIAVCKMGNCSPAAANRLSGELSAQLGVNITIDSTRVRMVYNQNISSADEDGVIYLVTLSTLLAPESIRLRTILAQAQGQGLFGIHCVATAMCKFPDFPWDQIHQLYPGEMDEIQLAVNNMKNRPYAGFNSVTMNKHGVSHYLNVAKTSRLLLIKMGGNDTMTSYRGLSSTFPYQAKIETMLDAYKAAKDNKQLMDWRTNAPIAGSPEAGEFAKVTALLADANLKDLKM